MKATGHGLEIRGATRQGALRISALGLMGGLLLALPARAQDPAPADPAAGLGAPAAPEAAAAAPAAPPPAPPPPAPEAPKKPSVEVGAWTRIGARVQGSDNPKALNDISMDTVYGELNASGKVYDNVTLTLDLAANGLNGTAGILDAIAAFDFSEPLHLWAGQLLVPVDRANSAGPFFMLPWNYPGVFAVGNVVVPATPHAGPYGRSAGAVLWGEVAEGRLRYYGGMFAPNVGDSPLYSGRVSFDVLGAEHGFWGNSTYFGAQNVVAIDVGAQYQKNGSAPPAAGGGAAAGAASNYSEVNVGAFGEYKLAGASYVTGEAVFYHFSGDFEPLKNEFYILAAYASDRIGIGQIQPMIRFQTGSNNGNSVSAIDVFVNYLIAGPALRIMFGFQHTDVKVAVGNALQLGVQAMLF